VFLNTIGDWISAVFWLDDELSNSNCVLQVIVAEKPLICMPAENTIVLVYINTMSVKIITLCELEEKFFKTRSA
jgi:hypothetical protein